MKVLEVEENRPLYEVIKQKIGQAEKLFAQFSGNIIIRVH